MSPDPDDSDTIQNPTLREFLDGSKPNAYVQHPGFSYLYVRSTQRFGVETIDLANLEADVPGNGAFTQLVKHLRSSYPDLGIYVESVLNTRFIRKLTALGFARCDVGRSICFFLAPSMELKDETFLAPLDESLPNLQSTSSESKT